MILLNPVLRVMIFFVVGLCSAITMADNYQWRNVTVGAGGFAPNIVYSPIEKNLAYLRTDMGGLYRFSASDKKWLPLQDAMTESSYMGVESVAPDPVNSNRVYAAVGMHKQGAAAILRSDNRGDDWQIFPVTFAMGGNEDGRGLGERLAADPLNPKIIYFGSRHNGLMRSTDEGEHWQPVETFPYRGIPAPTEGWGSNGGVSFVVFGPAASNAASPRIYVGVADKSHAGIYASDDAGQSWQRIAAQPEATSPAKVLLPVKAAVDAVGTFYVTYSNGLGPNGITDGAVYKYQPQLQGGDQTKAWQNISPAQGNSGGYMGVSVAPTQRGLVVVSTINRWQPYDTLWLSTDGGNHWQDLYPQSTQDVSQTPFLLWGEAKADFGWWIAGLALDPFDPLRITYTTGATVYSTRLASFSPKPETKIVWKPWDQGIEQTAIITLNSLPAGAEVLSGFGDISGFYHDNLSQSPHIMLTTPVFANTNNIDYAGAKPNIVVRSGTPPHRSHGPVPTLAWSQDYGKSWQPLPSPADDNSPVEGDFKNDFKRKVTAFFQFTNNSQKALNQADIDYIRQGNAAIATSADGEHFVLMGRQAFYTERKNLNAQKNAHWQTVQGLPEGVRPVPDRINGHLFYALDFKTSRIYVSNDSGKNFSVINSQGLPKNLNSDQPTSREQAWPLHATPDHTNDLWLVSRQGLFHSENGGKNFQLIVNPQGENKKSEKINIQQLSFGRAAPNNSDSIKTNEKNNYPTLYAIAEKKQQRGIYRSLDKGVTWQQINDKNHQYGQRFRTLAADPKKFGRVYVGTDGRGIVYGDIIKN